MTQLVKDLNMARQHEILPWRVWMCLLSGPAWAHCCACHNTEVTSHMRCAICVSGWQNLQSLRWMVSLIGLYKGTSSYGLLLLSQALNNNELDEIHEKKFLSFQSRRSKSSATAGQATNREQKGENIQCLQAWRSSRENRFKHGADSIVLPSCEARGFCKCWGGKFGLYIGRP